MGSSTLASHSFQPTSVTQSGISGSSFTGSRGSSRAASRKKKRDKIHHDHVPITYLLGNKYKGYYSEINQYPRAQPLHNDGRGGLEDFFGGGFDGEGSLGYDSSSYDSSIRQESDQGGVGYNRNWISEPLLDEALSR